MTIAEFIKTHRLNAGLSQEELALKSGITRCSVVRIETGIFEPKTAVFFRICKVLNIDAKDFGNFYMLK